MATTTEVDRMVELLGGKRRLGALPKAEFDFIPILRKGLPYRAVEAALVALDIPTSDVVRILHIPLRTLARRRQAARTLSTMESERFLRFIRVLARAQEVLGGRASALTWMRTANRSLGSVPPEELLDTDIGSLAVLDTLGRLEHGVYG